MLAGAMTKNLKEAHGLRVTMTRAMFSLNGQILEPENYDGSEPYRLDTMKCARSATVALRRF